MIVNQKKAGPNKKKALHQAKSLMKLTGPRPVDLTGPKIVMPVMYPPIPSWSVPSSWCSSRRSQRRSQKSRKGSKPTDWESRKTDRSASSWWSFRIRVSQRESIRCFRKSFSEALLLPQTALKLKTCSKLSILPRTRLICFSGEYDILTGDEQKSKQWRKQTRIGPPL